MSTRRSPRWCWSVVLSTTFSRGGRDRPGLDTGSEASSMTSACGPTSVDRGVQRTAWPWMPTSCSTGRATARAWTPVWSGLSRLVTDMRTEQRWPTLHPPGARAGGAQLTVSSAAVPGQHHRGTQQLLARARRLRRRGAGAGGITSLHGHRSDERGRRRGVGDRNTDAAGSASHADLDMALGILIATRHCSAEEAFAILSGPPGRATEVREPRRTSWPRSRVPSGVVRLTSRP